MLQKMDAYDLGCGPGGGIDAQAVFMVILIFHRSFFPHLVIEILLPHKFFSWKQLCMTNRETKNIRNVGMQVCTLHY